MNNIMNLSGIRDDANQPLLLTIDIKGEAIMLNEGVLNALRHPKQVQILLNYDRGSLGMRSCGVKDDQAVAINGFVQAEISERNIIRKIRKAAGWDSDLPRICMGIADPENPAVFFDLKNVITIEKMKGSGGEES